MGKTHMKHADSKGRITLGEAFANRTLLVEEQDGRIILRVARVIPESEAWLYENPAALDAVRKGLQQAKARNLQDGPELFAKKKASKTK
jgi:Ser/Thr protein kinase RdoA (MazF antagonist)